MKHLSSLTRALCAAVLLTTTTQASAEDRPAEAREDTPALTHKLYAQVRPRLELRNDRDMGVTLAELRRVAPGGAELWTLRSRLGLLASRGALTLHLRVQHVARFGATGGDAITHPGASVALANASWSMTPTLTLELGRFALSYGDERVLGGLEWAQEARTWDGLRLKYERPGALSLHTFLTRYADGLADGTSTRPDVGLEHDAWLAGVYATLQGVPALKALDLYAIGDLRFGDSTRSRASERALLTLGTRAHGAWHTLDTTVEAAYQLGTTCAREMSGECAADHHAVRAFFVDAELGWRLSKERTPARLYLGGSLASGDDPDTSRVEGYDQLYPTPHKFLGYTDVIGPRTNVLEARAGGSVQLSPSLKLAEAVHLFASVEPTVARYGVEADTSITLLLDEGLVMSVGYGIFAPGPAISSGATPSRVHHWAFAQLTASL